MKYLISVILKIILLPVTMLMMIPAYAVFIINPEFNKFKFKLER